MISTQSTLPQSSHVPRPLKVLPCTRILTATGRYKDISSLTLSDYIVDSNLKASRIKYIKNEPLQPSTLVYEVKSSIYPLNLKIPDQVFSKCMYMSDAYLWKPLNTLIQSKPMAAYKYNYNYKDISTKHNLNQVNLDDSYETGYIIGAYIVSGSLDTANNSITMLSDGFQTSKLMTIIKKLDASINSVNVEWKSGYNNVHITGRILYQILFKYRERSMKDDSLICLVQNNKEFSHGVYDGILESPKLYISNDIIDLAYVCNEILYSEGMDNTVELLQKYQLPNPPPSSVVSLYTDTKENAVSAFCNGILLTNNIITPL